MENLPETIIVDIISRLPIKNIIHCRSVCKTWQTILSDSYFAELHLSRSPANLMIQHEREFLEECRDFLTIVEVKDEANGHQNSLHEPLMSLDLTLGLASQESQLLVVGSVHGWLCLWQFSGGDNTYICNPLTREYMILPRQQYYRQSQALITYGFGFSLLTNQYKVVRIFDGDVPGDDQTSITSRRSLLEVEIYTLGTGKWRSLGRAPYRLGAFYGPFLNGCVHWLASREYPEEICSFDMEKETFALFPSPPKSREVDLLPTWNRFTCLGVIRGSLCKCDTMVSGLDIWMMKEYGIKKSWTKDIVVKVKEPEVPESLIWDPVYVKKGLKDGTILFTYKDLYVFSYSQNTKKVESFQSFEHDVDAIDFVPSFRRLRDFELENVQVFQAHQQSSNSLASRSLVGRSCSRGVSLRGRGRGRGRG